MFFSVYKLIKIKIKFNQGGEACTTESMTLAESSFPCVVTAPFKEWLIRGLISFMAEQTGSTFGGKVVLVQNQGTKGADSQT